MQLPNSVQEIADVIGRDEALYLIGQLPTCYAGVDGAKSYGRAGTTSKRSNRVILYVPKTLKPHHRLVEILGWDQARKLVAAFGGEILQPANCQEVHRRFRDKEIRRQREEGMSVAQLAVLFDMSERHIRNLTRAMPAKLPVAAND